jgi:mannosyltransferase OCH1-like enzyme
MSNTIFPKIIHQIWMIWSKKEMPPEWKKAQQKWKDLYSDYEYVLWGNENSLDLIKKEYPQYLDMYIGFEYNIQRADFIRYCILKLYGGIYADLDIVPEKKFTDETFYGTNSDVYLTRQNKDNFLKNSLGLIQNNIMVSKKNILFWDYVMKEVEKRYKKPSWKWLGKHVKVLHTTGPIMLNYVVNSYPYCITLLPNTFNVCGICGDKKEDKNRNYVESLPGNSWGNIDTKIIFFVTCNFQKIIIFLLICLIIFIYFFFKYKSCCNNKKCK